MDPVNTWLGVLALLITTVGSVVTVYFGRTRTTRQEITVEGEEGAAVLPAAPSQPDGAWFVSPAMYQWFQDQMAALNARVNDLEDSEREQKARGDRLERLLRKALTHIDRQDQRMTAAGMELVPMDPELTAARSE